MERPDSRASAFLKMAFVEHMLSKVYTAENAELWWHKHRVELGGLSPSQAFMAAQYDDVLDLAEQLNLN